MFISFRKETPCLCDTVKYFDYFRIMLSCNFVYGEQWSGTRSLPRALETEQK